MQIECSPQKCSGHLEDQEGDGKITVNWILGRRVMRMGDGWNRIRIVSSGGLWY
jgi:hypothetical protein